MTSSCGKFGALYQLDCKQVSALSPANNRDRFNEIELNEAMLVYYSMTYSVYLRHIQNFQHSLTTVNGEKTH